MTALSIIDIFIAVNENKGEINMFKKRLFLMVAILSILGILVIPNTVSGETIYDDETDIIEIQSTSYRRTVERKYPKSVYESGRLPKSINYDEIILRQYYSGRLQLHSFYFNRDNMVVATYAGSIYPSPPPATPLQNQLILDEE